MLFFVVFVTIIVVPFECIWPYHSDKRFCCFLTVAVILLLLMPCYCILCPTVTMLKLLEGEVQFYPIVIIYPVG